MSLRPATQPESVPADTARVARAAFPRGNPYLRLRDELGSLFADQRFTELFPTIGQPAESPARLALISVMQFAEGLSDRQAADAVRARIDWKYVLGLELDDSGFDHTVLSEFRTRLVAGNAERLLLDDLLGRFVQLRVIKPRGRQRTDSTHVLAAVRTLNRLERIGEILRATLNALATVAPEWLSAVAPLEWYERYEHRVENYHLPKSESARREFACVIGADGRLLLQAIEASPEHPWLCEVPAVKLLRTIWSQQYTDQDGKMRWLENKEVAEHISSAEAVCSPYDLDARYSRKRDIEWVGYKVHFTETCDDDAPRIITNVETTPATTPDDNMLDPIHESLKKNGLLPAEHVVDKGYTDSRTLVESKRDYDVTVIGPVADDPGWQARAKNGFDKSRFPVDWDQRVVTCPEGKKSISFLPNTYPKNGMAFEARFASKDCTPCPSRSLCTRSRTEPRIIGLQPREQYEALQYARRQQTTEEFQKRYAVRAGVEGTHSQADRRCGVRENRYIGLPKTILQHTLTAVAINVIRITEWWKGTPIARTPRSRFARLRPLAA
jgi:transposase